MAQILHKGDSLYSLLSKCFFVNYLISSNTFCSDPSSFYLKHEECICRYKTKMEMDLKWIYSDAVCLERTSKDC